MNLLLRRRWFSDKATIGELFINGAVERECYTLEDVVRVPGAKVYGATAIPTGTYEIVVNFSQRFQRPMPLLLNVPGFEGIRIHPGNTDEDTEGCILVGLTRKGGDFIGKSQLAFTNLFYTITKAVKSEKVLLEIRDEPTEKAGELT